jgi:hypothetical protein
VSRVAAALLAWAGAVAAQQDAQQVEAQVRDLVEQGRERLWAGGQAAAARERFVAALALPGTWSTPFAELGLAALARLEGNLPEALDRLAKVRRRTAAWPMGEELPRLVRFDLHIEAGLCNLAMGLLDRAGAEFAAAAEYVGEKGSPRMVALDLARVDLALAAGDLREARRTTARLRRALEEVPHDVAEELRRARTRDELRLRELLVERRSAPASQSTQQVVAELLAAFRSAEPGSTWRTRLGFEVAQSLGAVGEFGTALDVIGELCQPPYESLQRQAELHALRLGLLMRSGAAREACMPAYAELQQLAAELFEHWGGQPLRRGGTGTFQYQARREILGTLLAADRVLAPDLPMRALAHLESALSLGTLSRRLHDQPLRVEELAFPEGGGALCYLLTADAAHWFAIDVHGVEHFVVPTGPAVEDRLAELARRIDRQPVGAADLEHEVVEGLVRQLAGDLLPPVLVARMQPWTSALLVGSEGVVPSLQALPVGGTPIGIAMAVAHVPSLSLYAALCRRAARRAAAEGGRQGLALFADPELSPGAIAAWQVEDLRLRTDQIDHLMAGLPVAQVRRLLRDQATVAALRSDLTARARQLTIIAHGVEDFRAERSSAITVAGSGAEDLLGGDLVEQLRVPPLVVLGVCGAAGGPLRLGDDGVHHLGGAFVLAGADQVVLAGGQLAVGATIELVGEFTRGVWAGVESAEALRAARSSVWSTPDRRHPYYWAGMRLLGLHDFERDPSRSWRLGRQRR